MFWSLFIVGCLIIAGLGFYAGQLLYRLKRQNEQVSDLKRDRIEHIESSIQTIAFAMTSEQCEPSEGSIRLAVLLENYIQVTGQPINAENQYPFIFELYNKIKHMPTHEARKMFSKKEIRQMDKERLRYEAELKEKIIDEAVTLKNFGKN